MKKIIEKHENLVCYLLIAIYVVVNSYCMQNFGLTDYRSAIINTVFSIVLVVLIISSKRVSYYGLTGVTNLKGYLYFIPLLLIVSVNLWNGFNINNAIFWNSRISSPKVQVTGVERIATTEDDFGFELPKLKLYVTDWGTTHQFYDGEKLTKEQLVNYNRLTDLTYSIKYYKELWH